jgi:hypothetical protein
MVRDRPVEIPVRRWAGGWCIVGRGSSCLLFDPQRQEVTHLASGLHRKLRKALKGHQAITKGKLTPIILQLLAASAEVVYDVDLREDVPDRRLATFAIILEIQKLVGQFSDSAEFEKALRRLAKAIRSARQVAQYRQPPGAPENRPSPPGSFFAQTGGQEVLVFSDPSFVFRREPESQVAECAQKLWRQEQAGFGGRATSLFRVPTRKELREYLCTDESAINKLCQAEGFNWLPRATRQARAGRRFFRA